MDKRHDDLLNSRLEQVIDAGVAHVLWEELYRWYDVKKIAAGTLRDLNQRWNELAKGKIGRLMKIEGAGGIFLIGESYVKPVHLDE